MSPVDESMRFQFSSQRDEMFSDVPRTKKSGDWKNWFLQEDIDFFRPLFAEYMKRYGYPEDWAISDEPLIYPENGSRFVKSALNKFYEKNGYEFRIE